MPEDASWTGMQIDPGTGLLLPTALAKSRVELSQRAEREARGKFFSQMGRAERYNQAGAQEKPPDEPSFRYLRDAFWESQIDQLCVMRRQGQIRQMARRVTHDTDTRIGWTVRHRDHASPRFKETAEIRRRCAAMAEIIDHPTAEIHPGGFQDVATSAVEDELVMDRKCFPYETVLETDQGPMWIGRIVQHRLPVKIRSINTATGQEEWGQVVDWQIRRGITEWITLRYQAGGRFRSLRVTPDHDVWTPRGMVAARDLAPGDAIYVHAPVLSPAQHQVMLGLLLGDGWLHRRAGALPKLHVVHRLQQADYLAWIRAAFPNVQWSEYALHPTLSATGQTYEAWEIAAEASPTWAQYLDYYATPDEPALNYGRLLEGLDALGLAVWLMDDGSLASTNGKHGGSPIWSLTFPGTDADYATITAYFAERWGVHPRAHAKPCKTRPDARVWTLAFSVADTAQLQQIVGAYVQAIPRPGRGATKQWCAAPIPHGGMGCQPVPLKAVEHKPAPPKKRTAYDVTVEPTHTIIAHRVVTSNCMVVFADRRGLPAQYHLIDGATVKPIVRVLYAWIEEHRGEQNQWGPDMWDVAAEALSYQVGFDLTKAAWVQEIDGVITAAWTADQLSVRQEYPSVEINRIAYGRGSPFQRSLTLSDLWISWTDYNRGLFSVDYPENLLLLFGDYSPAGLEAFTRQLTSQVGNRNWNRLAVVPADPDFKAQVQKLRDTPKDMVWPSLMRVLVALKTAVYGLHPSEINMASDRQDRPAISERNQTTEIEYAKEEGLDAMAEHQADWINRTLVWPRDPDLEMAWVNLHRESERERIELASQRVQRYWTINEARQQENMEPLDEPWADMPLPLALQAQKGDLAPPAPPQAEAGPTALQGGAPYEAPSQPGRQRPRTPDGKGDAPPDDGSLQRSATVRWSATHGPRLVATTPEGWWRVVVDGRRYIVQVTPYGTQVRGVNGALLFSTTQQAQTADEAVGWIADYRQEGQDESE